MECTTTNILTTDAAAVIEDEEVDIVVELVGGTSIAKDLMEQALRLGKPVVTANKALLADHGADLYALADERDTGIYYEAAVGGDSGSASTARRAYWKSD